MIENIFVFRILRSFNGEPYDELLKARSEWVKAEVEFVKAEAEWLKAEAELVKTDAEGTILWRQEFALEVLDILETQDGGIVLLTSPDFNSSGDRISLIKLNAYGTF